MINEWQRGDYTISTEKSRLNLDVIHQFLDSSYWAAGRSVETIRRSIENSIPFGIYKGRKQVGFARVITDYATFAWIADVFNSRGASRTRSIEVADGGDDHSSGTTRFQTLGTRDEGCPRTLSKVRISRAKIAREMDGETRP
jgi:hypothetical protein